MDQTHKGKSFLPVRPIYFINSKHFFKCFSYFRDSRSNIGTTNNAEYVIHNAQPSDTGTYACVAQSSAGPVEDRVQLIVSEDVNDISDDSDTRIPPSIPEEKNKTTGPPRGDIDISESDYTSGGDLPSTRPDEDLVNLVGSRAVFTCNAGE